MMYDLDYNDNFDLVLDPKGDLTITGNTDDLGKDDIRKLVERDIYFWVFCNQYKILSIPTVDNRKTFIKKAFSNDPRIKSFQIDTSDGENFQIKELVVK